MWAPVYYFCPLFVIFSPSLCIANLTGLFPLFIFDLNSMTHALIFVYVPTLLKGSPLTVRVLCNMQHFVISLIYFIAGK